MKHQKLFIGVVAVLVVALGAYLYFSGNPSSKNSATTNTLVSSTTGSNPVPIGNNTATSASSFAGSDIAMLLKNISQIKLNTTILQNPSFLALTDTSLTLPPPTVSGRVNPFARSGIVDSSTQTGSQINSGMTATEETSTPVTTTPATTPKTR